MGQDIFLRLAGINGESLDASHRNEIDVITWNWGVSQQSNMHLGSGGGAGRATVGDMLFEHYIDCASPNLVQYCLLGKHIPEAVLVMRKAGGEPLEYLKITMEGVLITQVTAASNCNMATPREEVLLSFARVRQEYVIQNARGGNGGAVTMGCDIKANAVV
ncbi:Hcp family type VI secretion system effector [Burkholderia ubonensis]|uniref:Hcp family type VI secretion system effector n=1 Tax=Burkholderia ubonensis TaxID=101571 RepID=UPI000BA65158|nr:type VI secretion system tube protein Hcp [Burkholderia ubonensis]PAK11180.1 Hcp1 family type VI secretion system effector [Burkholderia ubonensis]RQP35689.1 Hcp1 family type VI secretion system effector [Burkholderia ubonensis]RQP40595.1 Hcp1 family type VI secretion system effector [Burkholderia ubonensis]RQP41165.1 Hcp1 family type VI secretion system effector [Burkholderia ubonensis]RQP49027.1 Hcp1 family type VI secretion system effector [Burkholderia ubonensis]